MSVLLRVDKHWSLNGSLTSFRHWFAKKYFRSSVIGKFYRRINVTDCFWFYQWVLAFNSFSQKGSILDGNPVCSVGISPSPLVRAIESVLAFAWRLRFPSRRQPWLMHFIQGITNCAITLIRALLPIFIKQGHPCNSLTQQICQHCILGAIQTTQLYIVKECYLTFVKDWLVFLFFHCPLPHLNNIFNSIFNGVCIQLRHHGFFSFLCFVGYYVNQVTSHEKRAYLSAFFVLSSGYSV